MKLLVHIVDAQLLKLVELEVLKPKDIKQTNCLSRLLEVFYL